MAAQIPSKVESNVKSRVDSGRSAVTRQVNIVKSSAQDLFALKPVKAVIDLIAGTIDNAGDLIKEQAEITRKWIG